MDKLIAKISKLLSESSKKTVIVKQAFGKRQVKTILNHVSKRDEAWLATTKLFFTDVMSEDILTHEQKSEHGPVIFMENLLKLGITYEELEEALSALAQSIAEERKSSRVKADAAQLFIENLNNNADDKVFQVAVHLAVPTIIGKYTEADKKFFRWWLRDESDNLYMKCKDDQLLLVPFVEGIQKKIAPSPQFWTEFFKAHRDDIIEWDTLVNNIGWDFYEGADTQELTIVEKLHESIPKMVMDHLWLVADQQIIIDEEVDPKGKITRNATKITRNISMQCGNSVHRRIASEKAMSEELSDMLSSIDMSEIPMMKNFTNDFGEAYYRMPLDAYTADPGAKMPQTWAKFFKSKLKIQEKSQLYRIAKFIVSVMDAGNFSRQTLCLCGEGNDGKSTFCEVLRDGFNGMVKKNTFVGSCNVSGLEEGNTQNGLINCINAHLIIIPDVTDTKSLINGSIFKNITGMDKIVCQKKFANPIEKSMAGVKMIFTTNHKVFVENTFAASRVIPVYFTPREEGEGDWDVMKLRSSLLDEFQDFLKWCWAYSKAFDKKIGNENKNVTVICDIDNPDKTEKEVFQELYSKSQKYYYMVADEYQDDDESYFEEVFNELYEVGDTSDRMKWMDIVKEYQDYTINNGNDKSWQFYAKSRDSKALKRWILSKCGGTYGVYKVNGRVIKGINCIRSIDKSC